MAKIWLGAMSVLAAILLSSNPGCAQDSFPNCAEPDLPAMGECLFKVPQPLPAKWRATALMAPYLYSGEPNDFSDLAGRAELQVGHFAYDGDHRLMRATRYGAKTGGAVDLLIGDKATWVLAGDFEHPRCVGKLATPYLVPSRTWQDPQFGAACVGNHKIAPTIDSGPNVDWWKQKSPASEPGAEGEAADWFWMDANGYPTRTMFWAKHEGLPAVLGDYAFTNFYKFAPDAGVDLSGLAADCEQAAPPVMPDKEIAALSDKTQGGDRAGALVPGLSYKACSTLGAKPPTWPKSLYMASFSTAAKYGTPKPLVTSVYYRPDATKLRTRLHVGPEFDDALLVGDSSYELALNGAQPYQQKECLRGPHTSMPGPPKPDWGVAGHCQCMSVISDNPVLSPGRTTEIIGCPMPLNKDEANHQAGNTMFWMWYEMSEPMRPIVFMQTKPDVTIGTGLSLADYTHWRPQEAPDAVFTLPTPASCPAPDKTKTTAPSACMGCHNWSTNE
jgi:hypothetical protein